MKKFLVIIITALYPCLGVAQFSDFEKGINSYKAENFDQAITFFESAKKSNPYHKDSHLFLAISYLKEEFPILAETTSLDAFEQFDDEGGFLWIAGEALLMQNQPEKASEHFKRLYRYFEDFTFSQVLSITESRIKERWIETELYKSSLAYQNEDYDSAIEALDTVLRLQSDHPDALKNRIYINMEIEEWERALNLVQDAEKKISEDQELIRLKANIYYQLENLGGLLQEYRELYNRNPQDKQTAFTYADILIANQKGSEAELVIAELIEQYPEDKDVYWKLVDVQEQRMYIQEKAAALQWLLEKFPGDNEALRELSATYKTLEEYSDQRDILRTLLNNSDDKLPIYLDIADSFLAENRFDDAERELKNIKSEYDSRQEILLKLGDILQMQNKWEESIEVYERIKSEQLIRIAGTQLGRAYFQIENRERSGKILEEVIESGIDDPLAWFLLAKITYESNKDRAYEFALRALESGVVDLVKIRRETIQKLDEGGMFANIDGEEEEHEYFQDIAGESIQFLISNFDRKKLEEDLIILAENFDNSATLNYFLADIFSSSEELSLATDYAEKAIQINPSYYEAHMMMGQINKKKGNIRAAALSFERARTIRPESKAAYRNLIDLYQQEDNLPDLAEQWEIQFRGESGNEVFKEHLIEALHKAGRYDEAREIINQ
ncbi:tetratricopeptide repeat protein [Rhodohalobacter barkolensis]|uniref:Tetratricopeptide repeat-like domain-containing protein n=1 Tax=Rhodohalobacter barkolensis TaxID=2053187 RepID=A0A2N0VJD8_9BACT|nr:tetratricopeptide repeat protein [Rhodohalobacter barkolensis]PKD44289.1 hypothetical protein CWD77_02135 [Rhodohalobacter barkolensis]